MYCLREIWFNKSWPQTLSFFIAHVKRPYRKLFNKSENLWMWSRVMSSLRNKTMLILVTHYRSYCVHSVNLLVWSLSNGGDQMPCKFKNNLNSDSPLFKVVKYRQLSAKLGHGFESRPHQKSWFDCDAKWQIENSKGS